MMSKLLRVCWVDITTPLAALLNILILFLDSALPMCTTNCSHFLNCESRQGMYHCNCQAGFTGPQCDINVDECSSSPCVHGICEDGINQYDCVCSKGYWGNNCEKKINDKGGVFLRPVYVTLDNIFCNLSWDWFPSSSSDWFIVLFALLWIVTTNAWCDTLQST